jgi:hypothetical protein
MSRRPAEVRESAVDTTRPAAPPPTGTRTAWPAERPALSRRTLAVFLPTITLLCYFTSYSEGVVSATSFHSLSPPMHIVVALAFLAAVAVPTHYALLRGRRGAMALLSLGLMIAVWVLGNILRGVPAMIRGDRAYPQTPLLVALLLGALLTPFVARWLRRVRPLDEGELIAVYTMLMVGTLMTSYGLVHFMLPTLVSARYYVGTEGRWSVFLPLIPNWFGPTERRAIVGFWTGDVHRVPWSDWIVPLLGWTVLAMAAVWVMLCLSVILQRQWIDRERLSFPLVALPLAIARQEPGGTLNAYFRSPQMWVGFAVPVLLHTMMGLNQYYPSVPTFQFRHINVVEGLTQSPWNAIRGLDVTFYPLMVGISYLLTVEISFSVWFFYLVRKFLPVLGVQTGWSELTTPNGLVFPFADQQATGAWIAVVLSTLWVARRHLRAVLRAAVRGKAAGAAVQLKGGPGVARCALHVARERSEQSEAALSYRTAVLGAVAGVAVIAAWMIAAGMSPGVALLFLILFFCWCVALSRIRAEAGMGGLTGPMMPQETLYLFEGTSPYGARNLTLLAHHRWMVHDLRALPCVMPSQLENLKMGDTVGLSGRSLAGAMMVAVLLSAVIAYVVLIPVVYHYGGITMNRQRFYEVPTEPFRELSRLLATPRVPDPVGMAAVAFGGLFTLVLSAMRLQFLWWPFHPLGYAVGFSRRTIDWMWFSIFLGWLAKLLILRFGGMPAYRWAMPLMLGFILGEFTMGVFFGALGVAIPETRGYQLYP